MPGSEKQAGGAAEISSSGQEGLDRQLMQEYGGKYLEVQRLILGELPDESERLAWANRYGQAFHDLAAADASFHELVMSDRPDIAEIKRRVEGYGDGRSAEGGAEQK